MFKCDGYENNCDCPKCATKWAMQIIHSKAEAAVEKDSAVCDCLTVPRNQVKCGCKFAK